MDKSVTVFVTTVTVTLIIAMFATPQSRAETTTPPGIIHEALVLPADGPGVYEALLDQFNDGRYCLLFVENRKMVGKYSADQGRTWSEPQVLQTVDGQGIAVGNIVGHHSLLHLKSGKLGLVYGGPRTRPGRDGTVCFRTSDDHGNTWSDPIHIDPHFAVSRNQSARVLSTGRILVPVMKWISAYAGGESESESNNLCYS